MTHRPDHRSSGFTLLELMVVIGVISVLAGIGLGYLGKTDPQLVADSILAGEKRAAQMTARAEGVPTEVVFHPGGEATPAWVQARLLEPVAAFHFEPRQPVLDDRMMPTIRGRDVKAGRFGHARRSADNDRGALLEWRLEPLYADLREGFVFRIDLFLESRDACMVGEIEDMLELRLDQDLVPNARLKVVDETGNTVTVRLQPELAMPLRRWSTLEFGCDGGSMWLSVDGREYARGDAPGTPQQKEDVSLLLSPQRETVPGIVDECRLLAFGFSPKQLMPMEVQPVRSYHFRYNARGEAVDHPTIELVDLEAGL